MKKNEEHWNDIMKISGIYKIVNKINGKYYVGSSLDIKTRWKKHIYTLSYQKHRNIYLQRSWNKYGKDNFEFFIIETVPKEQLQNIEQKYLDDYIKDKLCYNLNSKADGGGWNDISKQKLSKKHKGMGNPFYGKHHTQNTIQKIQNLSLGRLHTSESKKKMSYLAKLKSQSLEWREKMKNVTIEYGKIHNPNFFINVYTFFNKNTKEIFVGTPHNLKEKYKLPSHISCLINKKRKSCKGWIIQ